MNDLMSFVGKSEIIDWGMILVARSVDLSAISLLVGTHISSTFFEDDFNVFWIFWVISFKVVGFEEQVKH
jgi:hypothetical protein